MRFKFLAALLVLALLAAPALAFAQSPNLEWTRWDAQITAQSNNQLQIVETQEVAVSGGTVSRGTRYWTSPVNIQAVYVMSGNGQQPQQLQQSTNGQPGTYSLTTNGNKPTLQYVLPNQAGQGSSFLVQINYTAQSPTTGMVDWSVIPADHPFPVRSSTVTLNFPSGQAPDPSLVRASSGNAQVSANGNQIVIRSTGAIPPQQAFGIQVPFGAGVGAAGNNGNTNNGNTNNNPGFDPNNPNVGNNPVPANPNGGNVINLPGGGTLLMILCVVGFLLLVGGGSILRGLLGGVLGGGLNRGVGGSPLGGLGGLFGGRNQGPTNQGPFNQGSIGRGFRQSSNQDRNIGNVGNDKDGGGGASFS